MIDWIKYEKGMVLPPVGTDVLVAFKDRTVPDDAHEVCTGFCAEDGGFMCEQPFDFHYSVITHFALVNLPE